MNGWSKDGIPRDEFVTCPECYDPHGARFNSSSMSHTYTPGCLKYHQLLVFVYERYKP